MWGDRALGTQEGGCMNSDNMYVGKSSTWDTRRRLHVLLGSGE